MSKATRWGFVIFLLLLSGAGFAFGYAFHMNTELERFAKETERMANDYIWDWFWKRYPGEDLPRFVVLARPDPVVKASRMGERRWRWESENPNEIWEPDTHRLIWRYDKDRWELVQDLEGDVSVFPFD